MPSLTFPNLHSVAALQALLSSIQLISPATPTRPSNRSTGPFDFINRLPPFVLSEIFTNVLTPTPNAKTLTTDPFVSPTLSFSQLETPFQLSHVCNYWMEVVNSTKSLWRSIAIYAPCRRHLYRTSLWMIRADSHPLEVSLSQSHNVSPEEEDATLQVLELLAYRVRSWKTFEARLNGEKFPLPLVKALSSLKDSLGSGAVPQLQNVSVKFNLRPRPLPPRNKTDPDSAVLPTQTTWSLIQSIPSLRYLHWDAEFTPGPSFSRTLETLEIHSPISIEEFLERIPSCQNLQALYIHNLSKPNSITFLPEHMDIDIDPVPRKPMPMLLRLGLSSPMRLAPILKAIFTPRLRVLELQTSAQVEPRDIRDLLAASGCCLQAFAFNPRHVQLDADSVHDWLLIPEIQLVHALKLLNMEVTDEIIATFQRPGEDGLTLFPALKELILGTCNADVDVDALLRMLGSRFWTVPQPQGPMVPPMELRRAEVVVRNLDLDLVKYADMICLCGSRMPKKPMECVFREA